MLRKISRYLAKLSAFLIVASLLIGNIYTSVVSGIEYSPNNYWIFKNGYLSFNDTVTLNAAPSQGKPYVKGLIGYWNFDETNGTIAHDLYGNNGNVSGASWVEGKYGNAASFDGVNDFINVSSSGLNMTSAFTIDLWIKLNAPLNGSTWLGILGKRPGWTPVSGIGGAYSKIYFGVTTTNGTTFVTMPQGTLNVWQHIVATYRDDDVNNLKLYRDGTLISKANVTGRVINTTDPWVMGKGSMYFNGAIDDLQIYNRALTENEVAVLSTMGDPYSFTNYYSYQDSITNNTMLIGIQDLNVNNSTLVTCTNFFVNNRLMFKANSTANINIWTNLGKPVYSKGFWNSENYTTTLTLDSNFTGIIDWNPGVPPVASNYNITSRNAGNSTITTFLWSDTQSLLGGGFIFSTNNTGKWVNNTWTLFDLNSGWGNTSIVLNGMVGVSISFREFANNTLNLWGDSGIYTIKTTADFLSTASPTPTRTPSITATPIPTAVPINPTPTAIPTTSLSPTPTTLPTSDITRNTPLTTQTIFIITAAVTAILFAVFVFSFRRGIIKIEVINEQASDNSETPDDYQI